MTIFFLIYFSGAIASYLFLKYYVWDRNKTWTVKSMVHGVFISLMLSWIIVLALVLSIALEKIDWEKRSKF